MLYPLPVTIFRQVTVGSGIHTVKVQMTGTAEGPGTAGCTFDGQPSRVVRFRVTVH